MHPFAELEHLTKQAVNGRALWEGVKRVASNGVWKSVGNAADKRIAATGGGLLSKGLSSTSRFMNGTPGKVLSGYGLLGLAEPLLPFELPGSQLAMNVAMPGWGALFTAPSAITSARMAGKGNRERLKGDVMEGGRRATDDFLSAINANPGVLQQPGSYRKFMSDYVDMSGADPYIRNDYAAPKLNKWRQLQSVFSDPQMLIDDITRTEAQKAMNSSALRKKADIVGTGMKALGWLSGIAGVGATGHALLKDKPYDAEKAQAEGYNAAQAAIQKKLNGLNGLERFALRMDPTFAAYKLDQIVPGTIKRWEQQTGTKFSPGWLSRTNEAWRSGGKPSYYQYDADGNRHYANNV
jgi:hypothetical protein